MRPMSNVRLTNKIQELVYELDAGSAMTRNPIFVGPDFSMAEIKEVLRENKISGLPVVSEGKLVGIISIEDVINWLADRSEESTVGERMTSEVVTVYEDEPLVRVINHIENHGYGRLPVLERMSGRISGIITKTDIMSNLLRRLDRDYREEEVRQYRASHFFEDIVADATKISLGYDIRGRRIEEGGEVASSLKKTLKRLGVHPDVVRKASISAYEAEMNVIIYAKEGRISVNIDPGKICMEVEDNGPGIPDIQQAMEPGYSTSPEWVRELGFGAGMGLFNIQNNADTLKISSTVGEGTLLKASFGME